MTRPFVSVSIVSVLEQDFSANEREILVVDDGSTDSTPEIIRKFVPHVRLLRKLNGGQASAFNAGIPECKGQIVAFLDGDDWWEPQKLSVVAAEFESHRKLARSATASSNRSTTARCAPSRRKSRSGCG